MTGFVSRGHMLLVENMPLMPLKSIISGNLNKLNGWHPCLRVSVWDCKEKQQLYFMFL